MIPTWTLIIITSWVAPCPPPVGFLFPHECNNVMHTVSSVPGFATKRDCQDVLELFKDGISGRLVCVPTAHIT